MEYFFCFIWFLSGLSGVSLMNAVGRARKCQFCETYSLWGSLFGAATLLLSVVCVISHAFDENKPNV